MYKLNVMNGDVYEWDKEEGQGEHVFAKGIDMTMNLEILSKQSIVETLKENFYVDLTEDDLFFANGTTGNFSVIENEEAYQDENIETGFLVDYFFTIERVNPLIDLEEVFGEGVA